MSKERIMIVEDDVVLAKHLKILLHEAGYKVVGEAVSGEEAIQIAQSCQPDLLIADIQLIGDMDGIEASDIIANKLNIPTLFLTSHSNNDIFDKAKITNPFAYLLKPVSLQELKLTIEMAFYRHQLEEQLRNREEHLREAQEIAKTGSWDWNIKDNTMYWTDQVYRIIGQDPESFKPTFDGYMKAVHPEDKQEAEKEVNTALEGVAPYQAEYRVILPDGSEKIVRGRGLVQFDESHTATRMQGTIQDVTELKAVEKLVERLAFYDSLTDLPNRNLFSDRLNQAISYGKRHDQKFAVLFLDLDDFKNVNDTHGHETGDSVLKQAALRLTTCVRNVDTVSRLGGDEFIIILDNITSKKAAVVVCKKIIQALSKPFSIDGEEIKIGCSIGISTFPDHAVTEKELVKKADNAMYESKKNGRNNYSFSDE